MSGPAAAEPRLLGETDCLLVMLDDLRAAGACVGGWDADAREGWIAACADLLRGVPNVDQRYWWAWRVSDLMGVAMGKEWVPVVASELLRRAEGPRG